MHFLFKNNIIVCLPRKDKHNSTNLTIHTNFVVIAHMHVNISQQTFFEKMKSEKAGIYLESNSGDLACAASALPMSYDNQTTTNPHNPLYILHRY